MSKQHGISMKNLEKKLENDYKDVIVKVQKENKELRN